MGTVRRRLRVLDSLLRPNTGRCHEGVGNSRPRRAAKLVVQRQYDRQSRGNNGNIESQPPIAPGMRMVSRQSAPLRLSRCHSCPNRTGRTRESTARIGRGNDRRNLAPAVPAKLGGLPGDFWHADSVQAAPDVSSSEMQPACARLACVLVSIGGGTGSIGFQLRRPRRFGALVSGGIGRGRIAWFHGIDPELGICGNGRRRQSRAARFRFLTGWPKPEGGRGIAEFRKSEKTALERGIVGGLGEEAAIATWP
jgi:hypothetical protein